MSLSNKQIQFLKAKAHELKPIILLGGNGLTEGVMAEVLVDGHFGYAATADLSAEGIQRAGHGLQIR